MKALVILCQRLTDNEGNPIVDTYVLPWSSMPPKSIKLTVIDLRDDVTWRSNVFHDIVFASHPKAWTVSHVLEWLNIHSASGDDHLNFIKTKMAELMKMTEKARVEEAQERRDMVSKGANWPGKNPILC